MFNDKPSFLRRVEGEPEHRILKARLYLGYFVGHSGAKDHALVMVKMSFVQAVDALHKTSKAFMIYVKLISRFILLLIGMV